jgi:ribosomal protein L35
VSWKTNKENVMKKEVFSPSLIDVLWGYTLDGDLLEGVGGLAHFASEMREHYIDHKTSQIFRAKGKRGYITAEETELLQDMLDYMLDRAEAFYENAEDIRAAFETVAA